MKVPDATAPGNSSRGELRVIGISSQILKLKGSRGAWPASEPVALAVATPGMCRGGGSGRGGGRPERRPHPLRPPPRAWGAVSGGEARAHRVAGALAPAPPRRAPHVLPASGARTRKRVRRPCLRVDASASRPDPRRALVRDLGNPHGVVSAAAAVADAGFCWVTAATTWVPGIVAGWAPPTPGVAA